MGELLGLRLKGLGRLRPGRAEGWKRSSIETGKSMMGAFGV